ncbi:MAG TPA: DinB family protein [Candidatus Limnocylindrales bacterium]|nr:DinB family protein [Candidatus Limnocylindrales bacterium]
MDEAWPPFRMSAAALGHARLESPTPVGWTFKAMLAHVAAWHRSAARRLRAFRETGQTGTPDPAGADALYEELGLGAAHREALGRGWDMDRFNAAVAEAAASRAPADVLRDLDASFTLVRDEAGRLSDAEVAADVQDGRSWAVALVAGDTYEHYEEHRAELAASRPKTAEVEGA